MGAIPKSRLTVGATRPAARADAGIALPSALMAIVLIGILSAAALMMADLNAKSGRSRESATRAMQVAEAGLAHALALGRGPLASQSMTRILLGSDNTANTADDGLLIGYGLSSALEIPAAGRAFGGGTYFVTVTDDPADPNGDAKADGNNQVLVTCSSIMADGAGASASTVVRTINLPGIVIDGSVEISGKLNLSGSCGGIHANGDMTGGGEPTVSTLASATGTVSVEVSPKQSGAPYIDVPDLDPALNCPPGGVTVVSGNWVPSASALVAGNTYCVTGNVELSSDFGSLGSMRQVSIIAGGSIKVSAKPFMRANHPDGIVLLAGGDMDIQGDAGFNGLVYGGGQCYVSSKPTIIGQFICKNKSPHPGADYVSSNLISGDAVITFECGGAFNQSWRIMAWYPNFGT